MPDGPAIDALARDVIEAAGHGDHFGHGLGHGIGLATHELPSLGKRAPEAPLPSPTVFSVEPGIYLDGETGVRIEDLVVVRRRRPAGRAADPFPREVHRRRADGRECGDGPSATIGDRPGTGNRLGLRAAARPTSGAHHP